MVPLWLLKLTLVTALAAHGADLASTENCLGAKRCHELNPWLARVDQPIAFGAAKMGVAGLGLYGSEKLEANHPKWALVLNLTVTGAYSAIAVHNSRTGH